MLGRRHLGRRHVMRVDARNAQPGAMHVHHDRERLAARLVKDRLEHPDHELLRRVVVVVQQHPPHPRTLKLLSPERDSVSVRFAGRSDAHERHCTGDASARPGSRALAVGLTSHLRQGATEWARPRHSPAADTSRETPLAESPARRARPGGWWPSGSRSARTPSARSWRTSVASATFEASLLRLNIDSPKNMRPSATP